LGIANITCLGDAGARPWAVVKDVVDRHHIVGYTAAVWKPGEVSVDEAERSGLGAPDTGGTATLGRNMSAGVGREHFSKSGMMPSGKPVSRSATRSARAFV
jgi:hypothetical protein